eukprot:GCRY01001070.1.p2 GENE.GCRY01001070.1~~GCRY01001070.1.p2  ORF type:complete len:318 (+),score=91.75 GCRY01001070.1:151-1104(+)
MSSAANAKKFRAKKGQFTVNRAIFQAHEFLVKKQEASVWIATLLNETIGEDFHAALKDGQILCKLINHIKPNAVPRVSNKSMSFAQMENIQNFLNACKAYGIPDSHLFDVNDLYEAKNLNKVLSTINQISVVAKKNGFEGPFLVNLKEEEMPAFTKTELSSTAKMLKGEKNFAAHKKIDETLEMEPAKPKTETLVKFNENVQSIEPIEAPEEEAPVEAQEEAQPEESKKEEQAQPEAPQKEDTPVAVAAGEEKKEEAAPAPQAEAVQEEEEDEGEDEYVLIEKKTANSSEPTYIVIPLWVLEKRENEKKLKGMLKHH